MRETAGHARTTHSAEDVATRDVAAAETTMTASETAVAGEAAAMTTAEAAGVSATEAASVSATEATGVSTATLRPQRHSQEKRERRDRHQAAHTLSL